MEMPEGWKKLDSDIPEGGQYRRIQEALNLMEEMAEALDSATAFIAKQDGVASQEDVEEYEVLKKFKEWK